MPDGRPRREDIDTSELDLGDVLYAVRLSDYRVEQLYREFVQYRAEVNGDIRWLRVFRSKATDVARIVLVTIPVALAAVVAIHLSGQL